MQMQLARRQMDNAVYTKEGRIDTFCLEADEVQWMNGGEKRDWPKVVDRGGTMDGRA